MQAVFLNPRTGVFSTDAGNINGGRGHGRGLVLTPGTYTLPLALSHIWAFDDFCFKVQVRCGPVLQPSQRLQRAAC